MVIIPLAFVNQVYLATGLWLELHKLPQVMMLSMLLLFGRILRVVWSGFLCERNVDSDYRCYASGGNRLDTQAGAYDNISAVTFQNPTLLSRTP